MEWQRRAQDSMGTLQPRLGVAALELQSGTRSGVYPSTHPCFTSTFRLGVRKDDWLTPFGSRCPGRWSRAGPCPHLQLVV